MRRTDTLLALAVMLLCSGCANVHDSPAGSAEKAGSSSSTDGPLTRDEWLVALREAGQTSPSDSVVVEASAAPFCAEQWGKFERAEQLRRTLLGGGDIRDAVPAEVVLLGVRYVCPDKTPQFKEAAAFLQGVLDGTDLFCKRRYDQLTEPSEHVFFANTCL